MIDMIDRPMNSQNHRIESFGAWIREQREIRRLEYRGRQNFSQADCAARANKKKQQWSNWENDRGRNKDDRAPEPRIGTIEAIAIGLMVPKSLVFEAFRDAFGHDPLPDSSSGEPEFDENEDPPSVIARYNRLPDHVKDDVATQINALYKKHVRDETTHGRKAMTEDEEEEEREKAGNYFVLKPPED